MAGNILRRRETKLQSGTIIALRRDAENPETTAGSDDVPDRPGGTAAQNAAAGGLAWLPPMAVDYRP